MLKKSLILLAIGLSVLFLGSCKKCDCEPLPTGTHTVTLKPGSEGKDAFVNSYYSNTNSASDGRFFLMAGTWGGNYGFIRGYIQFDYSSIPAGATVTSAKLTLYADTSDVGVYGLPNGHCIYGSATDNDWHINRVTSNWSETGITWNNQPTSDPTGQINVAGTTDRTKAYTVDVTNFVKDEIAHPELYYGLVMQLDNTGTYRAINFCSSDHSYSSLHPTLEVEYTVQ